VDRVDGGELAEGPTVLPVPVLFAGPEDVGCFLFLLFGSGPCGADCEREKGEDGAPDLIHSTVLPAREPSMAAGGGAAPTGREKERLG
jgi:hypothetical protein